LFKNSGKKTVRFGAQGGAGVGGGAIDGARDVKAFRWLPTNGGGGFPRPAFRGGKGPQGPERIPSCSKLFGGGVALVSQKGPPPPHGPGKTGPKELKRGGGRGGAGERAHWGHKTRVGGGGGFWGGIPNPGGGALFRYGQGNRIEPGGGLGGPRGPGTIWRWGRPGGPPARIKTRDRGGGARRRTGKFFPGPPGGGPKP